MNFEITYFLILGLSKFFIFNTLTVFLNICNLKRMSDYSFFFRKLIEYYQTLNKEKKGNYNFFLSNFYLNTNNLRMYRL